MWGRKTFVWRGCRLRVGLLLCVVCRQTGFVGCVGFMLCVGWGCRFCESGVFWLLCVRGYGMGYLLLPDGGGVGGVGVVWFVDWLYKLGGFACCFSWMKVYLLFCVFYRFEFGTVWGVGLASW